jgi:hypothetical protein
MGWISHAIQLPNKYIDHSKTGHVRYWWKGDKPDRK